MKRAVYITLFVFLGYLIFFLIYAAMEVPILALMFSDSGREGDSFFWHHWPVIHHTIGSFLSVAGVASGFFAGRYFWCVLYVEHRYGIPR